MRVDKFYPIKRTPLLPQPLIPPDPMFKVIDPAVKYVNQQRAINNEDKKDKELFEKLQKEHDQYESCQQYAQETSR